MAGSFDFFRKYQRTLLACVAILAMLAFFVLPPILDMAPEVGVADPLAATWQGGGIREGELQRAIAMRIVLNQFLRDAIAASGRNPGGLQVLGEDEADVVRTLLLAREAEANGITVGNEGVNRFLAQWTNNTVRPEQFEALLAGRRIGSAAVSPAELFAALRTVLAADRMRQLFVSGFAGDPPNASWDIFRRLEQEATVEVVPVVVESLASEVEAPAEPALRAFFERFKDQLPVDRSPDPGFKEPHRVSYEWLVANRKDVEAAAAKEVTEAEIAAFYEKNKDTLYRAKPAEAAEPASTEPAPTDAAPESKAAEPGKAGAEPAASDPKAAAPRRGPFVPVRLRQASDAKAEPAAKGEPDAKPEPDTKTARDATTTPDAQPGPEATKDPAAQGESPAAGGEKAGDGSPPGSEPLEKVRDDIRERLAAAAVPKRVAGIFAAISNDIVGYSRDLARWKADKADEASRPQPPNIDAIAEKQGLKAGRAEKRTAGEAAGNGGVGATFQLADPRSGAGFEPVPWTDLFFGVPRLPWRPVPTLDVSGNRYLSWKTEDFPAFVPEFADVRADVERAWRIVEARPRAEAVAKELAAAAAGGRSLADAVAGRPGATLTATTVGPFTWLARGSAGFGSPATVSEPEGLVMPGDDFMRAVFALEPGGTAVAFNEPRTVCYAIRLVSYAPSDDDLRSRFLDPASDRRRIEEVADRDRARAMNAWMADLEKRAGLEWKRPPQQR